MKMTINKRAVLSALLGLTGTCWASSGSLVLIDTNFAGEPGQKITPSKGEDSPLSRPTAVRQPPEGLGMIQGLAGAEGGIEPPGAKIQVLEDSEGRQATASMSWNLRAEGLQSGRFEVTYTISSLFPQTTGGRILVSLESADRTPLPSEPPLHPTQVPIQCYFTDRGTLRATQEGPRYEAGQPVKVTMVFDLDERVWSISMNGEALFENKPFPPRFADRSIPLRVADLSFSTMVEVASGEAGYVLGPVKMVRLP